MSRRNNIWYSLDWYTVALYLVLVFCGWISIYAASFDFDDIQFRYALGQAAVMDIVVIGYRFLYIDDRAEDIRFVILSVVYRFYRPVDHYDIRRARYKRFPFLDRIGPRTFATGRICQVWYGVGFGQNAR